MNANSLTARFVYRFGNGEAEGDGSMREELGGKGAGLAEMTRLGVPVPPGFTISTNACRFFLKYGRVPEMLMEEIEEAIDWLELQQDQRFAGEGDPLLVSVRSGAAVSMPGMMDTILNVGLSDANIQGFAAQHRNSRFAFDSYRRLLQMFGAVVLRVPKTAFDSAFEAVKSLRNIAFDSELDPVALLEIIDRFKTVIEGHTGAAFPMEPRIQLRMSIDAVFDSWKNERAQHYRRIHDIPEYSGTAVTVQAMVFGNYGPESGSGVGFTRNPSTGRRELYGEFLADAQGEDIVAGTRTPLAISELARTMPQLYRQLVETTSRLESHYRDVQDFEFTVQKGKLFLLQTRSAKRSAVAMIRTAVEMAEERLISKEEALHQVSASAIIEALSPQLDLTENDLEPIATGIPASPGSAVGQIVVTADRAVEVAGTEGHAPIILVRQETTADDIHGMNASAGFLTAHGGATSHAAVVARGMGKCCITGAHGIEVDEAASQVKIGALTLQEGDWLSLDGSTGRVFKGRLPLSAKEAENASLAKLLDWAKHFGGLGVRANADTPQDAVRARRAGAVGIGLCRTEHMFFAPDRLPFVRAMILAEAQEERQQALDSLLPAQQADFEEIFHAMSGLPVTIRLIDPPLHEFLPTEMAVTGELAAARARSETQETITDLETLLRRVRQLSESNPMLGHRGCRLGITYPEIITMQVTAILRAAIQAGKQGTKALPEIMVPLVACVEEVRFLRKIVESAASAVFQEQATHVDYRLGTMIELPRAAVCAGTIASEVDFLSFGTNDLTQMTFGFSRDDARKYLDHYLELGILKSDPFLTIDRNGVGELVRSAVEHARAVNQAIKIGVCGEHGGDPASIDFFHTIGIDYISCSAARIPVAQLSAAHAVIAHAQAPVVAALPPMPARSAEVPQAHFERFR